VKCDSEPKAETYCEIYGIFINL